MATRPRCLIVTRNFPPLTGGMERLNHQVLLALQKDFEIALCGPKGCAEYVQDILCAEFSATPAWRYVVESTLCTMKIAAKFKPDVIYAGSGLAAHAAALASFITKAPLITYLHGLDIIAPDRVYQTIFLPAIRRSNQIIVNSGNTALLAEKAGISKDRVSIIYPGTAMPNIGDRGTYRAEIRSRYMLGQRPVLLAAGRLTPRKGIAEFITNCMPKIITQHPDVCLLIVGESPSQALNKNARDVFGEIKAAIAQLKLETHIHLLGKVDDAELSSIYFASDLFIFPVLDLPGDIEGFGIVAIEAAAHGLPTIGFAVGGIPDAVADGISGGLASPGNYMQLTNIILNYLSTNEDHSKSCIEHASTFSWAQFGKKIRENFIVATSSSPHS
jgi:phosphatidylinositol alpha-1,6-mannosyltransferase